MAVTLSYCCSGLYLYLCRSELAREKLQGAAFMLDERVIVDVLREQARSYTKCCSELFIVNPPIVQLFSLTCSFLFRGESAFYLTR
ncbi:hypothetical protein [Pseudomonas yamanorum]|uniref:hypothetical protein n=1 Tax=Pseudomonas yamanorum TaxID=515393 RepID=UPI003BA11F38